MENTLPNNFLAEQIILGTIFIDKSLLPKILKELTIDAFYFPEHRILYKTIIQFYEKNNDIDLTTLISYLQENQLLELVGGVKTLMSVTTKVITTINIDKYISLLQEKYFRRLLILLGKSIIETTYNSGKSLAEILQDIEVNTLKLTTKRFNNSLSTTNDILNEVLIDIQTKFEENSHLSGLLTSFHDLDALLQGLNGSELLILAGRPSMGKTAFSLNIAKNICEKYNQSILIFSLEMSKQQLIYRFLSVLTGINSLKIKSADLNSKEWEKLKNAVKSLAALPIFIDDTSYITFSEIQSKSQLILQQRQKIGLIIVDYLQLMQLKGLNSNRNQELSIITRSLKILAKELNVPVLVLSQLSRTVESRLNKRPILSDLRDSGCSKLNKKSYSSLLKKNSEITISGRKPCYKLLINKYKLIYLTSNHKVFTYQGWKRIDTISILDRFQVVKSLNDHFQRPLVEFEGIYNVFETSVLKNSNYLFNPYLLHNSIEQDADIVMMLYRDDYYDKKSSTPGIVEIIIAKHRNGPIGSINLLFNNKSLEFQNLQKI